jgi:hypothetical protein
MASEFEVSTKCLPTACQVRVKCVGTKWEHNKRVGFAKGYVYASRIENKLVKKNRKSIRMSLECTLNYTDWHGTTWIGKVQLSEREF